ncbi:MAG: hypothetical protein N3C63_04470 [Rhodocyclaceae bacterium]|nr:hypothetical protein [Rhodocyclaceae bacterium]
MSGGAKDKTAQLLADIEEFSRHGPVVGAEPAKPELHRETLAFPDLSQPAAERREAVPPAPSVGATPTLEAPSSLGQVEANSLLARLKAQAQALQQDESQRGAQMELKAQILSATLGAAFHYIDDLIKQLNILKPAIPKEFIFPGNIVFSGLSWVEGAADFRMVPSATEDRRYESMSARFRLAAPKNIVIERDALGIEPFRKTLHDYNIVFKVEEKLNARHQPEAARFIFPCEIKAGFLIKADYERGDFVLRTRNIDRFGMMEFRLQAEELNHATLDELAHLFLGEKSRFLQMFRRTA